MTLRRVDVHAHYGHWPFASTDHSFSALLKMVHEAEIDQCWLSSVKAITADPVEGNRELFEIIEPHPELAGQVVINPHFVHESIEEIKKYMNHPQFVGLKTHPNYCAENCDSRGYREIFEAYSRISDKPILVHCFLLGEAQALIRVAPDFPPLPFIMAHMGGAEWKAAVDGAADIGNIYFEPACSLPLADKIAYAVQRAGPERFLFGTDLTLIDPGFSIGMVESTEIDEETKERIYCRNALRLLGHGRCVVGGDG
ncbi:MAG TPA: amidohydrolase family protein [bacterium]|nr:amidohydrolase family protein [bacterium]